MDDTQITNSLRALTFAEPPLGFDPEDVATKAAKRIRNRRASVGVAVATLAVIGGAAIFVAPGNNQKQSQLAAPSSSASSTSEVNSPATTSSAPTSSDPKIPAPCQFSQNSVGKPLHPLKVDVTANAAPNRKHLQDVLATVLPEAKDLAVSDFVQGYDSDILTAVVCFRDSAGPATFNLTIAGQIAWSTGGVGTIDKICGTDCNTKPQPDGSTVIVEGYTSVDPNAPAVVAHYRTDHTTVNIWETRRITGQLAHDFGFMNPDGSPKTLRSAFPLTEQQAIALVTDPAFNVK